MKTIIADFAGFCHGVQHTISTIEDLLKNSSKKIHCIGQPVHNPQLTNKLIDDGLHVVDSMDDIDDDGILVVRAHGLPPKILHKAEAKGLEIVDTTCRIVLKAQNIAKELHDHGYSVVIVGEPDHPEVRSIHGVTDEKGYIVSSVDDCQLLNIGDRIGILSQTTFSEKIFKSISGHFIAGNFSEIRVFSTICRSVDKRGRAACSVACNVDAMIVIGGKMSSNTKRLFEACLAVNPKSYHVETIEDLPSDWSVDVKTVGVTAGASTPSWIIEQICQSLGII